MSKDVRSTCHNCGKKFPDTPETDKWIKPANNWAGDLYLHCSQKCLKECENYHG